MLRKHILILLLVWLLASAVSLTASVLKAGVAKVDITPPMGTKMWGYFDREAGASATLDPLFARVLVLEAGDERLALVALDLGRTFGPLSLALLKEAVQKSTGIVHLLVVASHTHAGPVIQDEYPEGTPAWERTDLDRINTSIGEAVKNAVEARLGVGYGSVYIGYNRRRVNPDGTVTMLWDNKTKLPTSPFDPTVSVLRVDTASGRPLAILVNYACHAVIFGASNLRYSADFPGVVTRTTEKAFNNQPLCFFLQGACGDINPYFATTAEEEDPVKRCQWTGELLGQEAARVASSIPTKAGPDSRLDIGEELLSFKLRWDRAKLRESVLKLIGPKAFENYAPSIKNEYHLPVTTLLINRQIAFMSMPGEPFVDFQVDWRNRCPVRDSFFLGYANGYYGYFPTIQAASEGGYGASDPVTWIETGAGERMVDRAVVKVYELLGKLVDNPRD